MQKEKRMSGIAGVYFFDGRSVDRVTLEQMAASIAHRGSDGRGIWTQGPVGFCHLMLWTTPESLHEALPLVHKTGALVITADARIDNRDDLIAGLGLHLRDRQIPDSELILGAYEKWGERCPEKLLGDFAFTIWDGRKQVLLCARDHFGVKPFYYYRSDRMFAFASEIKALLCLEEIPRRLNETRVADYLGGTAIDPAHTFYQEVVSLLDAHSMVVGHERMVVRRYWVLDPSRELRLASDEAYAEAFREHFTRAVHSHIRSPFAVGALLSGGLDSSSIVCIARGLLAEHEGHQLHTFSAVYDHLTQCDERPFINAVVAAGGINPHYIIGDQLNPWTDIDAVLQQQEEPFESPFLFIRRALCGMARAAGIRVLLDGFMGDIVVSHGMGYLTELLRQLRWWSFFTQILVLKRTIYRNYHASLRTLVWDYGVRPLAPEPVVQGWRQLRKRLQGSQGPSWSPIIQPHFARRMHLAERLSAWRGGAIRPARTAREEHWRFLSSSQYHGFEVSDKAAAAFDMSASHPFADLRLAEFCLSLPAKQKLGQGWSRLVFRRAMTHVLPAQVQWRRDKSNHHPLAMCMLFGSAHRALVEGTILQDTQAISAYVDLAAVRDMYHRNASWDEHRGYASASEIQDALRVWRAVLLGLWLKQSGLTA
jgi:asparagine synthase (glutamine-hydrolysing)